MIYFYLNYSATAQKKLKEDPNYFKDITNKATLFISYNRKKQPFRVSTGVNVNPNFWDKRKQIIKSGETNHTEKNKTLELLRTNLMNIINEAIHEKNELSTTYLKERFYPCIKSDQQNIQNESTFLNYWNKFISNSINKNEATQRNYKHTLNHIIKFSQIKNIDLALYKINKDFYEMLLVYFFKDLKITRNTAGKHVKNLKAFMRYCYKMGYTKNAEFKNFKIMKDNQILNYLTPEEIKILYNIQLTNHTLEFVRDVFIFACFTGLRFSDLMKINPDNIRDNGIFFIVTKTKQPQFTPLHQLAKDILEKYNGTLPRKSNQIYGKYIKQIGKLAGFNRPVTKVKYIGNEAKEETAPLWKVMSMHMAKRTCIMNLARTDTPIDVIMKITGNKDRKTLASYYEIRNDDTNRATNKSIDNLNLNG